MLLAMLLALVALAGCSEDDPTGQRDQAQDDCLAEADRIPDESARKTAREACETIEGGNTDDVTDAAEKQCLDQLEQVPEGDARDRAERECKRIAD